MAHVMKAADYAAWGRRDAANARDPSRLEGMPPFPRDKRWWGAQAYWRARDEEDARLRGADEMHVPFAGGWPPAAREHTRLLLESLRSADPESQRAARISRAVRRMYRRHGGPTEPNQPEKQNHV